MGSEYEWALIGGPLERPLYYVEDIFVPMSHTPARTGKEHLVTDKMSLPELTRVGAKKPFMGGRFQIATCTAPGISCAVAAFDGDKLVSAVWYAFGYTVPEYRRSKIGVSIAAELDAEYNVWCPIYGIQRHILGGVLMPLSKGGEAMMREAFHLMVQRGAVIPRRGDNSWHMERWKSQAMVTRSTER
jgi:hypothetical protein